VSATSTSSPAYAIGVSTAPGSPTVHSTSPVRASRRERVPVEAAGHEDDVVDDQRGATSGLARRLALSMWPRRKGATGSDCERDYGVQRPSLTFVVVFSRGRCRTCRGRASSSAVRRTTRRCRLGRHGRSSVAPLEVPRANRRRRGRSSHGLPLAVGSPRAGRGAAPRGSGGPPDSRRDPACSRRRD
jgi:hypothetical protein